MGIGLTSLIDRFLIFHRKVVTIILMQ